MTDFDDVGEIVGLDHLYLAVSDFGRAERFYDRVMRLMGFRKGVRAIADAPHCHYFNRVMQISIRPANAGAPAHDPYAPGVHHICLQVADRGAVDRIAAALTGAGIEATEPRLYPEYDPDYYATFFEDPDGIRFEVVARRPARDEIVRLWPELVDFVNPVAKWKERNPG